MFYNVATSLPRRVSATRQRAEATPYPRDLADDRATGTTVHEAIHQLMFHTGVQTPHIEYPLWICEGLATAFETDDPDAAFGPDHEYAPRRDRFDLLLGADQLIELRQLVTYARMPDDSDETVQALYHQSYALVTWMSRFRRDELRAGCSEGTDDGRVAVEPPVGASIVHWRQIVLPSESPRTQRTSQARGRLPGDTVRIRWSDSDSPASAVSR